MNRISFSLTIGKFFFHCCVQYCMWKIIHMLYTITAIKRNVDKTNYINCNVGYIVIVL